MKFQNVNITTPRIEGLTKPPFYFDHNCFYACNIMFKNTSMMAINLVLFWEMMVMLQQSATQEKMRGLMQPTNLQENFCTAQYFYYIFKSVLIYDNNDP